MNESYSAADFEALLAAVRSFTTDNVFPSGFNPVGKGVLDGEFLTHNLLKHPCHSLFHYYSDMDSANEDSAGRPINYSREALTSGKVHLSSPRKFNDPYDCTLAVNNEVALTECIKKCASIIGMGPLSGKRASELAADFVTKSCSRDRCQIAGESEKNECASLSVKQFRLAMECSAAFAGRQGVIAEDVLAGAQSVVDSSRTIGDRTRVFCLSTVCNSLTMWAYYANNHKGFCVEYDVSESFDACVPTYEGERRMLLECTRPVVYSLERPDCTGFVIADLFSQIDQKMMEELYLRSLHSKGLPWSLESEWRMVLPQGFELLDNNDNIDFFPIRSVCAGALMEKDRLESLAELCGSRGLPLFQMHTVDSQFVLGAHRVV